MSQNRIAQRGVGQPGDHRNLDGGQGLPRTDTEGRESEDPIAISLHDGLHEPAGLRKRVCTQVGFHWDFEQSIWNPLRFRVILMQSNVGQFRVGKGLRLELTTASRVLNVNNV
jgi:hypothetical protein